jgi:hypothetical protein
MFIIGLMIAVLLVEYVEAVRPLPLCPASEPCATLLPSGKGRAIMGADIVIGG